MMDAAGEVRTFRAFLCHSSADKTLVKRLGRRLLASGFSTWLDDEQLLPGQNWEAEIRRAVRESQVVLVCLSSRSITKEGYVQKEIRHALDVAEEKPDGTIFLIPVRLEVCEVPERLRQWQWVDVFEKGGYEKLLVALQKRATKLGLSISPSQDSRRVGRAWRGAQDIASDLLADLFQKTPSGPQFGSRINFYAAEKECIASRFAAWLVKRIEHFLRREQHVCLIIGSGTSLYRLFEHLGPELRRYANGLGDDRRVLERLRIITNNLPGVQSYLEFSRAARAWPDAPLSDLVRCEMLGGATSSHFSDVGGAQTNEALLRLRREAPPGSVIMAMFASTWVAVRTDKSWPTPLDKANARSEFTRILVNNADEAYLLAPLGKILRDKALQRLMATSNEDEAFIVASASEPIPGKAPSISPSTAIRHGAYIELFSTRTPQIRLVSTARAAGTLLEKHYATVRNLLHAPDAEDHTECAAEDLSGIPHLFFPFDEPSHKNWEEQRQIEFPHPTMNSEEFISEFLAESP